MKNGDYFKGIFLNYGDNINDRKIAIITKNRWYVNYSYFDDIWYYMKNNKLYNTGKITINCHNLITYQDYENWILNQPLPEVVYEIY